MLLAVDASLLLPLSAVMVGADVAVTSGEPRIGESIMVSSTGVRMATIEVALV